MAVEKYKDQIRRETFLESQLQILLAPATIDRPPAWTPNDPDSSIKNKSEICVKY